MDVRWDYRAFDDLRTIELYKILALRGEVFVVEQKCIYKDADGNDPKAMHVMGWRDESLVAYARVLPPGVKNTEPSIGRVAVAPEARGQGLGKRAMQKAMECIVTSFGPVPMLISAQANLTDTFYLTLGFKCRGDVYDEDGIPHIAMIYSP